MPRRDDWDDDDDASAGRRRSRDQGPGIMPWLVIGGLGAGLLAVVAVGVLIILMLARGRDEQPEDQRPVPVANRVPNPPRAAAPSDNWPRLIGTWRAADPSPANWLREFVVRPDRTAALTFHYPDGRRQVQETQVAVIGQGPDMIRVQFRIPNGMYSYIFRFRDDNNLETDGTGRDVQVYSRVK